MELRNCARCGSLFGSVGTTLCNGCMNADEETFELVRAYLREHPAARVFEVSEATGVQVNKIYEYVRAGKLMTSSFSRPTANECVQCGAKIASGRLCHRCSTEGVRRLYTGERYRRR